MKYQKPKIVAQSAPKKSYVANCPPEQFKTWQSCYDHRSCMCGDGTK